MSAGVECPRCPAGPWTEPGRLAGHLVDVHGQTASAALLEARQALQPQLAKSIQPNPQEAAPVKKKRAQQKCRICSKAGHNAKSCTEKPAAAPPAARARNKVGKARGPVAPSSNGAGDADLVAKAQADARALVRTKIDEELLMARAFVAELERLASA